MLRYRKARRGRAWHSVCRVYPVPLYPRPDFLYPCRAGTRDWAYAAVVAKGRNLGVSAQFSSLLHHTGYVASYLHPTRLLPPREQLPMASIFTSQNPFERLGTSRRQASTKAAPSGYKPSVPSSKKNTTAPPTGFAAIGSYNTIARRYEPTDHGPSFTKEFQMDCYYGRYSYRGGHKLCTLPTRYGPGWP